MSEKHTETEVKLRVSDMTQIQTRLVGIGAELTIPRTYEKNTRYENTDNSLTEANRVLRLRQDSSVRLTYKEPYAEGDNHQGRTRTELEVEVSDFETTDLLLGKLGYHPAWIYEKYRTTFKLGRYAITLDEVPFGNFIEIEGDADGIEGVIKALDLADSPPLIESYSDLFFALKERLGLTFRDMTFANFRGIVLE